MIQKEPEVLVDLVLNLQAQITELQKQINKNSRNSNKPPSSDGLAKPNPKSLRKSTGRKSGGQQGHPGSTLKQVEAPDHTVILPINHCSCNASLTGQPIIDYEKRQVFELPEPKLEVTEYCSEIKCCPNCGKTVRAKFPPEATASVQYGEHFLSLLVYLHYQQLLPMNRISQLCNDLYGYPVSESILHKASRQCHDNLENHEFAMVKQLQNERVIHVDETGVRVNGKLHWLHTASTDRLTLYGIHQKRGTEAMNHFDVLPHFSGCMVHDFWKPYLTYDCSHSLCNSHLLRELVFLFEEHKQVWAAKMFDLLLAMKKFVDNQKVLTPELKELTDSQKNPLLEQYKTIIKQGFFENPKVPIPKPKRGRAKQTKAQNLLDRLENHESSVLAFFHDMDIPFTNNQAEQDLRMVKVRQKISGCFRTLQGAKTFARIRGYISTARKNERSVLMSITQAITSTPFMPETLS